METIPSKMSELAEEKSHSLKVSVQIFKGTELLLLVGDGINTGLDPAERKKKETRA